MQEQIASLEHQQYQRYTLSKHLGELLQTMTREQPGDPLGSIEEMSTLLWKQRHVQERPTPPSVPTAELDRCTAVLSLIEKKNSDAAKKLDDNFFGLQHKWANIGVSIGKQQSLMLQCSLIKLAEKEEIKSVRFWGVFLTALGNIYIAEADIDLEHHDDSNLPPVGPYDVPPEVGVGVNRFVYYVTKSPFDEWTRLPDCRPSDVSISRKVTWQLTGDLNAAVHSFVPYEVTEDIYLRSLIARISSATILAPTDYIMEYQPEEEEAQNEPENDEEEEGKEPPPKQLRLVLNPEYEGGEVDNVEWVHVRPFILPQGREVYKKAPKKPKEAKPKKVKKEKAAGEEEEEEEEQHEEEANDEEEEEVPEEPVEMFQSIENDEGFGEEEPCWNNRVVSSHVETESIAIAESLRWPGAFNITDGKKANSLYWGTGTKFVVNGFQPPAPPPLAGEYRRKMKELIDPTVDEEKEVEKLKHPPKEEEEEEDQQE